jgi:hypothetical protein
VGGGTTRFTPPPPLHYRVAYSFLLPPFCFVLPDISYDALSPSDVFFFPCNRRDHTRRDGDGHRIPLEQSPDDIGVSFLSPPYRPIFFSSRVRAARSNNDRIHVFFSPLTPAPIPSDRIRRPIVFTPPLSFVPPPSHPPIMETRQGSTLSTRTTSLAYTPSRPTSGNATSRTSRYTYVDVAIPPCLITTVIATSTWTTGAGDGYGSSFASCPTSTRPCPG